MQPHVEHPTTSARGGSAEKYFCSRIRENSDDSMDLQKSYNFCYVGLALFLAPKSLTTSAREGKSLGLMHLSASAHAGISSLGLVSLFVGRQWDETGFGRGL